MKSHRILLTCSLLIAGLCVAPALAQPEKPKGKRGVNAGRPNLERPGRAGQRIRSAETQLQELTKALQLDDAQQAEIEQLLKDHEAQVREIRKRIRPSDADREEMMKIRDDMKRARDDKDKEAMEKCRQRMRQIREAQYERTAPAREQLAASETKLHDDILAKLNDQQRSSFEDVWATVMTPRGRRAFSKYDPRLLKRTVMRLKDLTPDQKSSIDTLFKDFQAQHPDPRRARDRKANPNDGNKAGKAPRRGRRAQRGMRDDAAAKKLYDDVMAQLTDSQKKEVEKVLERARGRRGPRGLRNGQGGRGRFQEGNQPPKPPAGKGDN